MPKPDRKPDPDFEPDYDAPDAEYDDVAQADHEVGADADYDLGADTEYDDEPQADYSDDVADPDYDEVPVVVAEVEEVATVAALPATATPFAFELGRAVLPLTQEQAHPVLWRGVLKERHPATGLVQRVPVYRLDDGYWDCYREEELQAA